jgi:hypothetical protein
MPNCIYCNFLLDELEFYCTECANQIKCKACNNLLKPNAKACGKCGSVVGSGKIDDNGNKTTLQPINTFELTETLKSRKVIARLTDQSVGNLSETLSRLAGTRIIPNVDSKSSQPKNVAQLPLFDQENEDNPISDNVVDIGVSNDENDSGLTKEIQNLFYKHEDKIILDQPDLKASGQLDYGKRLVYLRLLYATEIEKQEFITRDCLNETVKEAVKLDGNISNWISNSNDLMLEDKDGKTFIRLKGSGKPTALGYLNDVLNSETKGTFLPSERSHSGGKNKATEEKPSSKSSKNTSAKKDVKEWSEKWKSNKELSKIDGYSVIKDKTSKDKAVFALWAIRQVSPETRFVSGGKLSSFLYETFVLKVDESNIRKSLNDSGGLVIKVKGGYEINPDGIKHIQNLLSSNSTDSKNKSKK